MKYRPKIDAKPINIEERLYETLNDVYPEVEIAGLTFLPGDIVKQLDPVAFRVMAADEYSFLLEEDCIEIDGELYNQDDVETYGINLNKEEE
jgi:hypothetical protein